MQNMKKTRRRAYKRLAVCLAALLVCCGAAALLFKLRADRKAEQARLAAEQAAQAAAEQARREAEEAAAAQAAAEATEQARLAAEAEAEQRREEAIQAAAEAKEGIEYGDCIGTVRVEGTEVDCELYWGDTNAIFRAGAGCSADNGCVMPGENGTVFVGAHTDTYFNKLFDAEEGALIHLDTIYGDFVYEITGFEVIGETEVDKCRWGAEEPSCILYTCYPQGIQVPTPYRYLAYADPVETDENGVVPQSLPGLSDAEEEESAQTQPNAEEAEAPAGESED